MCAKRSLVYANCLITFLLYILVYYIACSIQYIVPINAQRMSLSSDVELDPLNEITIITTVIVLIVISKSRIKQVL